MRRQTDDPAAGPVRLTVVIPAYNEARRLPGTLQRITAYLADHPRWLPAEIIVVDDGSNDGTGALVDRLEPGPGLSFHRIGHARNRGKGAAVRTGFAASRGEAVLLSDADLATPIAELDRLAGSAADAVAIGSRAIDRGRIERRQPIYRDFMGRVFNLVVRILALPGIHDSQCGFKLFPGELARRCAGLQRIDGFAFDVELLLIARTLGHDVVETPVRWRHVEESRVRPVAHSLDMLADLLRLGWRRVRRRVLTPASDHR